MSGEDDPDYLKGVEQPGFGDRDNFTVKTSEAGPLGRSGYKKRVDDDDDDDDEEERPPFQFPWIPLLLVVVVLGALATLFAAGVAATGTWVDDAERAALVEAGNLSKVVEEERKILDELGARGANRTELSELYGHIDETDGHQRGLAALAFTRRVDTEVANIGDIRGTAVEDRHKKLAIAQQRYEEALGSWTSAAGNPIGAIAVAVGLADAPPTH
ncbi:MAG: hypothetical protein R3F61_36190 [Myxococcota bacterium]